MPIYTNESIVKHPWLWKFDSRRSSKCHVIGHRYRWFHHKLKRYHIFFGPCKKCDYISMYRLTTKDYGLTGSVYKEFGKVVTVTKEEAEQFMGQYTEQQAQANEASVSETRERVD